MLGPVPECCRFNVIYFHYILMNMLSQIILPFLSLLSVCLKIYTCISATISGLWQWKVQLNDYNAWNRMCTNHTFIISFHNESSGFMSNTNWNCHHNHTMHCTLVKSDTFSLLECANWMWNFWGFFFSALWPSGRI